MFNEEDLEVAGECRRSAAVGCAGGAREKDGGVKERERLAQLLCRAGQQRHCAHSKPRSSLYDRALFPLESAHQVDHQGLKVFLYPKRLLLVLAQCHVKLLALRPQVEPLL